MEFLFLRWSVPVFLLFFLSFLYIRDLFNTDVYLEAKIYQIHHQHDLRNIFKNKFIPKCSFFGRLYFCVVVFCFVFGRTTVGSERYLVLLSIITIMWRSVVWYSTTVGRRLIFYLLQRNDGLVNTSQTFLDISLPRKAWEADKHTNYSNVHMTKLNASKSNQAWLVRFISKLEVSWLRLILLHKLILGFGWEAGSMIH